LHSERAPASLAGDAVEFFRMLALLATRWVLPDLHLNIERALHIL